MKENSIVIALGLGLAAIVGFSVMGKPRQKLVFGPNETVDAVQGQMFTIRLPAGHYVMDGGSPLVISAQNTVGIHTDIVVVVGSSASDYTVKPRFTNMDNPSQSYLLTVGARKT